MQVKLHGEFVDINDDQSIRAHGITHAQVLVGTIPAKRRREAMERLVAALYFFNIKLGAVCAELQATGEEAVNASYFREMTQAMQAMLGLAPTRLESPNDGDPDIVTDTSVADAIADKQEH